MKQQLYVLICTGVKLRDMCSLTRCRSRVPSRIFGPKRDEVTGGQRKLLNEKFNHMYSSANIICLIK
jgi:hypothetical protein